MKRESKVRNDLYEREEGVGLREGRSTKKKKTKGSCGPTFRQIGPTNSLNSEISMKSSGSFLPRCREEEDTDGLRGEDAEEASAVPNGDPGDDICMYAFSFVVNTLGPPLVQKKTRIVIFFCGFEGFSSFVRTKNTNAENLFIQ